MVFDLDAYETKDDADWEFHFTLVGKRSDPKLAQLKAAVEYLRDTKPAHISCDVEEYFESQYEERLKQLRQIYGGVCKQAKPSQPFCIGTAEGTVLYFKTPEDFFGWALARFKYEDTTNLAMYKRRAFKTNLRAMMEKGRHFCSLGFSVDRSPPETVGFELFSDIVPATVAALLSLFEHPPFLGSLVHRIVPGGWIQCGDLTGSGGSSALVTGGYLPDENLGIKLDAPGLLCMCNSGPDTNGSQFFITVKPMPFFTGKFVVVGRVISGMRVVRRLAALPIDPGTERPRATVRIEEVQKDLTASADSRLRAEVVEEQAAEAADEEMQAAASKVQSLYRGRAARKEVDFRPSSSVAVGEKEDSPKQKQKMNLGKKKRKETKKAGGEEDLAATRLQAAYRGSTTRKTLDKVGVAGMRQLSASEL